MVLIFICNYLIVLSFNRKYNGHILAQVYESVETMLLNPEEALKMMKQTEESSAVADEPKSRFKRLSLIFGGKDKLLKKPVPKDQKNDEEKPRQSFSNFLDSKSSLFSKKPPRPGSPSPSDKPSLQTNLRVE